MSLLRVTLISVFLHFFSILSASDKIYASIKKGAVSEIKEIIASNPDVLKHTDTKYGTPLIYAVSRQRPEIAALLIESGADPAFTDKKTKENALFHLLDMPQTEKNLQKAIQMIEILKDSKIDFNAVNAENMTPLYQYCTGRQSLNTLNLKKIFLQKLIDAGADPSAKLKRDLPLLNAVLLKVLKSNPDYIEIAKLLIQNGVSVNEPCRKNAECKNSKTFTEGDTPLHIVIKRPGFQEADKAPMIKLLVENGAKIRTKNKKKETPRKLVKRRTPEYDALCRTKVKRKVHYRH